MTPPRVIGLYSSVPQSGKTTIAYELQQRGYICIPFASPLKRMVGVFLGSLGYSHQMISTFLFEKKEQRIPELGVSARHLMQTLGSEWGRECISPSVWIDVWRCAAQRQLDGGLNVVVDDCRFSNEYQVIKDLGGEMWRVKRTDTEVAPPPTHMSEGNLDSHSFDRIFLNDSTVSALHNQLAIELALQPALT